ncbi:TetR/AcrR family transcriptional regulator [Kitasatospora sp. MMS16-BH015]|uniref:TetR/AcrR family transcriptional regulator n=1 Tax=Kitasatospora sp. MMS16-BH015 TaxID=2018025 RepID=UPI0020C26DC5|nr:TetR/AcrR family transcriptional regulator C-terminal domain-containing protein [Kitasatospora sp. MMS16-BH015]
MLSRQNIARAALDLVDEQGSDGLTMRAVAERLGVKAASLYNHVSGREDILDGLAELVNAEIDLGALAADSPLPWREGLAVYARGYRAAFLRHPHTIALLARRRVGAERQLLGYETLLAALARAGLTPADAAEAAAALDYLVLGSALETFTAGFTLPPADYAPAYPALATALEASTARPGTLDDRGFDLALRLLLAGLGR